MFSFIINIIVFVTSFTLIVRYNCLSATQIKLNLFSYNKVGDFKMLKKNSRFYYLMY